MNRADRHKQAALAYLSVFQGEGGVKASTEDALLAVLVALYPAEYPESSAETIYKLRADERFHGEGGARGPDLSDWLYELECEGLDADQIAARLVPELDRRMDGVPA